jgi:hypothetical protein
MIRPKECGARLERCAPKRGPLTDPGEHWRVKAARNPELAPEASLICAEQG